MAGKLVRILRAQQKLAQLPTWLRNNFLYTNYFQILKKPSERINSSFTTPSNQTLKSWLTNNFSHCVAFRNKLKHSHQFSKVTYVKHHVCYKNILWKQKTIKIEHMTIFKTISNYCLPIAQCLREQETHFFSSPSYPYITLCTVPRTLQTFDKDLLH